jgi:hypothetical protein
MWQLKKHVVIAAVIAAAVAACSREDAPQEPPSAIVNLLTIAGSGDVSKLDDVSIKRFLNGHSDVARQVSDACAPLRPTKRGTAWDKTTEGRVCEAVRHVYVPNPVQTDKQGFKGGTLQ